MKSFMTFLSRRLVSLAVLVVAAALSAAAATRTISGIVLDELGEPLPGATVKEVPASKTESVAAVMTDINGHFSLTMPDNAPAIEVYFIGYKLKRINLTAAKDYKIELEPNSEVLNEVVVTGYQTISKERATGSFAKVDRAQLESQNITSVSDMLEGHVAGYTDGKIRGITSMQGVSQPLYVVDGFPVERTTVGWAGGAFQDGTPDINVDDIESITVLKDAAATSIYGARAANGVIVITTKKAKKGTTNVAGSVTFTVQPYKRDKTFTADSRMLIDEVRDWMGQNPNFRGANAQSYAENLLKTSSNLAPHTKAIYQRYAGLISEQQLNSMLDNWSKQGYRYYDETDDIQMRNATTQRYNVSISTANDVNSFVGTVAYYKQNPFNRYSNSQNLDISLRNSVKLAKWLTVDLGASVIYTNSETSYYNLDGTSPNGTGYTFTPYMSFYNEDGSTFVSKQEDRIAKSRLDAINKYGLYSEDIDPMDELGRSPEITSDLLTRVYTRLIFNITDWLKFTTQFQYEFGNFQTKQIKEKETYYVRNRINNFSSTNDQKTPLYNLPYGDMYSRGLNDQRAYNFRNQLDFNKTFAEDHDVTAIAGLELRHNKTRSETSTLFGYDDQMNTWTTVDQTALQSFAGAIFGRPWISSADFASINELTNRFISFYANAAYTYKNRYMLNGSIRTDRTNLFGTGSKYQGKPIWSVGAAWRIDEEKFFNWDKVNMLKLRASYGIGGNIAKNQWPYLTAYYGINTHPGVGGISGNIS
ncbi:MAG: SusC/RagA family TonB-linked outer membrane protein [Muribaculaceae bacterium]|nr:SusC/RagA family TonB-linked outer membrane protein [Muribaculaceae bacterium]